MHLFYYFVNLSFSLLFNSHRILWIMTNAIQEYMNDIRIDIWRNEKERCSLEYIPLFTFFTYVFYW